MDEMDTETVKRVTGALWSEPGLPRELAWVRRLSDVSQRRFYVELFDACRQARATGDWNPVVDLLRTWERRAREEARARLPYRLRFGAGEEQPI